MPPYESDSVTTHISTGALLAESSRGYRPDKCLHLGIETKAGRNVQRGAGPLLTEPVFTDLSSESTLRPRALSAKRSRCHRTHPGIFRADRRLPLSGPLVMGEGYLYPIPQSGGVGAVLSIAHYILAGGLVPLIIVSTSAHVLVMTTAVIGAFFWLQQHPMALAGQSATSGLLTASVVTPLLIAGGCFVSHRGWVSARDGALLVVLTGVAFACGWDIQRGASLIASLDERLLMPTVYGSYLLLPPLGYGLYALALGVVSVRGSMTRNSKASRSTPHSYLSRWPRCRCSP